MSYDRLEAFTDILKEVVIQEGLDLRQSRFVSYQMSSGFKPIIEEISDDLFVMLVTEATSMITFFPNFREDEEYGTVLAFLPYARIWEMEKTSTGYLAKGSQIQFPFVFMKFNSYILFADFLKTIFAHPEEEFSKSGMRWLGHFLSKQAQNSKVFMLQPMQETCLQNPSLFQANNHLLV